MKEPSNFLDQYNSSKRKIHEVVMNTVELDSTKDATEIMVSIIYIIYANTNLG